MAEGESFWNIKQVPLMMAVVCEAKGRCDPMS